MYVDLPHPPSPFPLLPLASNSHTSHTGLISGSTPVVSYAVNKSLDAKAIAFGDSFRQALFNASGMSQMHTYVNYAHGDETLQEVYGYEAWRQYRLKSLKTKYDPKGKFDFYEPI